MLVAIYNYAHEKFSKTISRVGLSWGRARDGYSVVVIDKKVLTTLYPFEK